MTIFEPIKLADTYLVMGGYIDEDGNVYREKDVLNEDFATPLMTNKPYVSEEPPIIVRTSGDSYINVTLVPLGEIPAKTSLTLTKEEYRKATREATKTEVSAAIKSRGEVYA